MLVESIVWGRIIANTSAARSRMAQFSETLVAHAQDPVNRGALAAPDLVGRCGNEERPPYLVLELQVAERCVTAARFRTHLCGVAIACGSVLTELVIGRSLDECRALTPERLIAALGGVPEEKLYCPAMAVAALRDALKRCS
jgi:NifU-like protein involved in Fe-S cluster formation